MADLRMSAGKPWISRKFLLSPQCYRIPLRGHYPDLESLQGKTIAYVFGTNYQQVAESIEGAETVGIQGSPACIEEVKSGRADACIIDGAGATELLKGKRRPVHEPSGQDRGLLCDWIPQRISVL